MRKPRKTKTTKTTDGNVTDGAVQGGRRRGVCVCVVRLRPRREARGAGSRRNLRGPTEPRCGAPLATSVGMFREPCRKWNVPTRKKIWVYVRVSFLFTCSFISVTLQVRCRVFPARGILHFGRRLGTSVSVHCVGSKCSFFRIPLIVFFIHYFT